MKMENACVELLRAELVKFESSGESQEKKDNAKMILSKLDSALEPFSLYGLLFLVDYKEFKIKLKKGLNGNGIQFDHRGSISISGNQCVIEVGESKSKTFHEDEPDEFLSTRLKKDASDQCKLRLGLLKKVMQYCSEQEFVYVLKGYVITTGDPGNQLADLSEDYAITELTVN
eukprot:NODE_385_length_8329_cov_0.434386.p3 type:complete len:173 gc:universal NODE_385_length_8329_cov_0.434386:3673-4191(+)